MEYIAAEKISIFRLTRKASVVLPHKQKYFFADDGSVLAKGYLVFFI